MMLMWFLLLSIRYTNVYVRTLDLWYGYDGAICVSVS
jgi:hypothetical protein